jgi:hypothetical protein
MTKIVTILFLLIFFCACNSSSSRVENKDNELAQHTIVLNTAEFIPDLSDKLHEISGLLIYDDLFWGFNDSGGEACVYGFSKTGNIKKEVKLKGVENEDWESITQDDKYIYIGDFGNNSGTRKNLKILKIKKHDILNEYEQQLEAETIEFNYAKQQDFNYAALQTPFDCEAMVSFSDELYLFSKDWVTRTSTLYKISKKLGDYELTAVDSFNVQGLITGADLNPDKTTLALLGYENFQTFIWLFNNFKDDEFFGGENVRIQLPDLENAQSEGISFMGNDSLLISCENSRGIKQQVFVVDLTKLDDGTHKNKR